MQSSFINSQKLGRVVHQSKIDHKFIPSYMKLHSSGELKRRGLELMESLKSCKLCPRECRVDRLKGAHGACRAGKDLEISDFYSSRGEEASLVGINGSGMIFFTHCSLQCIFCNSWKINIKGSERFFSIEELSEMMMELQNRGCHNINLVTPSHYLPHILLALDIAADKGLRLPIVYNSGGWESFKTLEALFGVVDIYLVDLKFLDPHYAGELTAGAREYPEVATAAILEMQKQVGVAKIGSYGMILRGLIIRHLVMPNFVSSSTDVFKWIAKNLPHDTYVHILSNYDPGFRSHSYDLIARPTTPEEYSDAVYSARSAGLYNLDVHGITSFNYSN